jgi:hypothetical protein
MLPPIPALLEGENLEILYYTIVSQFLVEGKVQVV